MRHQKAQRYIGSHRLVTIPLQMTNVIPVKVKWQCMRILSNLPKSKRDWVFVLRRRVDSCELNKMLNLFQLTCDILSLRI